LPLLFAAPHPLAFCSAIKYPFVTRMALTTIWLRLNKTVILCNVYNDRFPLLLPSAFCCFSQFSFGEQFKGKTAIAADMENIANDQHFFHLSFLV